VAGVAELTPVAVHYERPASDPSALEPPHRRDALQREPAGQRAVGQPAPDTASAADAGAGPP
jgi:hypothetical protein